MNKRQRKKLAKKLGHKKARIYNNRVWVAGQQKRRGRIYYSRILDPNYIPEPPTELEKAYWDAAIFGYGVLQVFDNGELKHIEFTDRQNYELE